MTDWDIALLLRLWYDMIVRNPDKGFLPSHYERGDMPLVTITTARAYTLEDGTPYTIARKLGLVLPQMFYTHQVALHLDPDTPMEGTQVRFDQFGPHDVNTPDLGVLIFFTETLEDYRQREVCEAVKSLIMGWLDDQGGGPPDVAVDIFWTPGHSFMRMGNTVHQW
jgi:hypothetical protein